MPIVNGNYYMNGDYGQGLEQGRIADAFPGLADQTGDGDSWADRLVNHLTTPRSASEPPPPPAPPGMPPEAYDDMKINQLTVRQVANVIANENHDVTPGTSSSEELQNARIAQAHGIINADRTYGVNRDHRAHTAPNEVTPELENSPQYQQALSAARTAFRQQLSGYDPTGGRMWFDNRFNEYLGPRKIGNGSQEVFRRFGPFQHGSQKVYTTVFENLKDTPGSR
jgi:hypothetical protein